MKFIESFQELKIEFSEKDTELEKKLARVKFEELKVLLQMFYEKGELRK